MRTINWNPLQRLLVDCFYEAIFHRRSYDSSGRRYIHLHRLYEQRKTSTLLPFPSITITIDKIHVRDVAFDHKLSCF